MILGILKDNVHAAQMNARKGASPDSEEDDVVEVPPGIGWLYVGSHNFTPSAWGTLSGSAFSPILNVSGSIRVDSFFPRLSNRPAR